MGNYLLFFLSGVVFSSLSGGFFKKYLKTTMKNHPAYIPQETKNIHDTCNTIFQSPVPPKDLINTQIGIIKSIKRYNIILAFTFTIFWLVILTTDFKSQFTPNIPIIQKMNWMCSAVVKISMILVSSVCYILFCKITKLNIYDKYTKKY